MSELETKPLNWTPSPDVGYTVERRSDGGMYYNFTDVSHVTLEHWRKFALEHLINSDRLTRNLYDLRQVADITEEAVQYALEVGSDPSTRNIRVAVIVADDHVLQSIREIGALMVPGGVDLAVFTDMEKADAWLDRPLTLVV